VGDAQIAVGRQPPVQLDFALTRPLTLFRSTEIQEVAADGLLAL
jgi:hypothetical protein